MALEQNTPKKRSPKGKTSIKPWQKAALFSLILVGIWFKAYLDTRSEPVQYAHPPHFQYHESTYVFTMSSGGYYTHILPDGFALAGETTDIGESLDRKHLEGNISGYVYMDPENSEIAYVQHKEETTYWRYDRKENW